MIKINLVPQEILDKETQRQRMMQVGVATAFVVIVLTAVSFSHYQKKQALVKNLEIETGRLKKFQAIVDQVNAFEAQSAAVRSRLGVMEDLVKSRELYPTFMVDLIESFPDGIWISNLTTAAKGAGLSLTMPAFAKSTRDVTDWLRILEESKIFSNAKISPLAISAEGKHTFSMTMDYAPLKPSEEKK